MELIRTREYFFMNDEIYPSIGGEALNELFRNFLYL